MSYKASFISKLLKRLRPAYAKATARQRKNSFSEHVGKWLAGEGKNFITMATL